jgi:hypothetical protein
LREKNPTVTNLNSYLQIASSTEELTALYQEIQKNITDLIKPPVPTPNPSPAPPTPPANK